MQKSNQSNLTPGQSNFTTIDARLHIEDKYEYYKWCTEIPDIKVPDGCTIKVVPPIAGAIVRFIVGKGQYRVSVYLDCYDTLGLVGKPYWEIYPDINDECHRFDINDTTNLMQAIEESLYTQEKPSMKRKSPVKKFMDKLHKPKKHISKKVKVMRKRKQKHRKKWGDDFY